jgi:predicted TIM-barrel fold metal-dependent hydrolase
MNADSIPIVDCHAHFLDSHLHTYPVFQQRSPGFEGLVGDYSTLPRRHLREHYLKDVSGFNVVKTVWAEFMSDDPIHEVWWAENLSNAEGYLSKFCLTIDERRSRVILEIVR